MLPDDAMAWLRLHHASGIGCVTAMRLLEVFGDAQAVCAASAEQLRSAGFKDGALKCLHAVDSDSLSRDLGWLQCSNHHLLPYSHEHYPRLLREISDPPLVLYAVGDVSLLNRPQLAVVGSRHPSPGGVRNARELTLELAKFGLTITSGLALGIDAVAHQAALGAGGTTIAVAGTGLETVYPARHWGLARRIMSNGALISEFSCGVAPHRKNFPRRNRLMSGISLGVLVIEAEKRSGSLITARLAGEQGREVFAVPGSIINPLAAGCHKLIQEGAKLVQSAQDVLDELPSVYEKPEVTPARAVESQARQRREQSHAAGEDQKLSRAQKNLLQSIPHDEGIFVDALVEASGLEVSKVSSLLLGLELNGFLACKNGAYIRVR